MLDPVGTMHCRGGHDGVYVEICELPGHPWYLGCQFHPEFKSKPMEPHPLFRAFIGAAKEHHAGQSKNLRRPAGLPFPDAPRPLAGKMFQPQFAGREKHRHNAVALLDVLAHGAAAADGFVVRMWRDDKDVHARESNHQ